jgi:competence transcription factor ComK
MLIFSESSKNVAKYFDLIISEIKKKIFSNRSINFFGSRQFRWVGRKGETNKILKEISNSTEPK